MNLIVSDQHASPISFFRHKMNTANSFSPSATDVTKSPPSYGDTFLINNTLPSRLPTVAPLPRQTGFFSGGGVCTKVGLGYSAYSSSLIPTIFAASYSDKADVIPRSLLRGGSFPLASPVHHGPTSGFMHPAEPIG